MTKKRRPGRLATGRKRNIQFKLNLSPEEKELISSQAEKHGLSMTDYLMTLVHKDKDHQ
ncbi:MULTISPECIES: plasmid mobilization protein [Aerococcus]|uniref:plasmid mobilization protein n=1 Tax=Aerococcus urinae (strain CCUG 59500 / ACS-120-V-Col10a) TaxID=2976812 RepID=UPI000200E5A5|nr:hypothetical protein [Aerococcus sp. Group 1]AEA01736.1 hypothetical protein HMPREF9243_1833 [Aerococcus sp. Group 1]MCY3030421.1 hypothetical protein [Aerococcus sp. Group 1]MCY3054827.1 hypothetical protein [Aerococcus sp. Group 1]MCY3056557.1 hypothetical protein [Aerococcus sp. Group 1]MCY3061861.1 hypothetical protein [Aerococcus sp. Group 1]